MTVCIAAIYNTSSILGISDRMITAGDIEFEPPQTKIFALTSSITLMIAGDYNLQTQIYLKANEEVQKKIAFNPKKWVSVKEVAEIFRDTYLELKREAAERAVLQPFGLTYRTFVEQIKHFTPTLIDSITYDLKNFSFLESIETIITGIDDNGAHIYTIRDGEITCDDLIGFSAIGSGSNHAQSHFMLSRYTRFVSEPTAILTIHQAKKKAEVTPGVGEDTDMFIIGGLGTFMMIYPIEDIDIVKALDNFYKKYKKGMEREYKKAEEQIKKYLVEINKANPNTQANQQNAVVATEAEIVKEKPEDKPITTPAQAQKKIKKG